MKKQSVAILLILVVFCIGCYPTIQYSFKPIEGKKHNVLLKNNGDIFTDEIISIKFDFDNKTGTEIHITNNTESPIRILWEESAFIDTKNLSHRVLHIGIKQNEFYNSAKLMDNPQAPTIIYGKTALSDKIIPADYAVWDGNRWVISEIFETVSMPDKTPKEKEDMNNYLASVNNKIIKFILPISFKENTIIYSFTFNINAKFVYPKMN
jgi:hypothetical protein